MKQIRLKSVVTSPTVEVFTGAHAKTYTQEHKKPFTPESETEESLLLSTGLFEVAPDDGEKKTEEKKTEEKKADAKPEKTGGGAGDETKK